MNIHDDNLGGDQLIELVSKAISDLSEMVQAISARMISMPANDQATIQNRCDEIQEEMK